MKTQRQSWPKVDHGLNWMPYDGWTILFDAEGGRPFDTTPCDENSAQLAGVTGAMARTLGASKPDCVAVLPISTHHITVCDGVDPAMFARSPRSRHHRSLRTGDIDRFPRELRTAITTLLETASSTLDLEINGAELRGTAIVVNFDPTHACTDAFSNVCSARADVLRILGDLLGLELGRPWRPHVTLGYLTDRDRRRSVRSVVAEIDAQASDVAGVLRMSGAGLYRFTSMVNFVRVPELGGNRS